MFAQKPEKPWMAILAVSMSATGFEPVAPHRVAGVLSVPQTPALKKFAAQRRSRRIISFCVTKRVAALSSCSTLSALARSWSLTSLWNASTWAE